MTVQRLTGCVDVDPIIDCEQCPVWRETCAGEPTFCPFITRSYRRGELLCTAGEPADYVWFVKKGVIGLSGPGFTRLSGTDDDDTSALRLPGSFIGAESLVTDRYSYTVHTLTKVTLCGATRGGFRRWVGPARDRFRKTLVSTLSLG